MEPSLNGIDNSLINRVAVRIPPFCADDPELWFAIVERSFASAGVSTDLTKFGYVTAALDPRYAMEVRDVIVNPPATSAYDTLKCELIKRLSTSQEQKTRRLLEHEEIGDRKPSQFLRHLRSLAGTSIPDSVVRTLWMGRLPANMQAILATQKDASLDKVAELADAVADSIFPRSTVAETTAAATSTQIAATVTPSALEILTVQFQQLTATLRGEIYTLRQEISELKGKSSGKNFRGRSRSRSRSGFCWYHWRFAENALKCTPPCNYKSENSAGSR